MGQWYTRPLFFDVDVERARDFYVNLLGFTEKWSFTEAGKLFVAQAIARTAGSFCPSQWPEKNGEGMLFISLTTVDYAALPGELAAKGVTSKQGWWGYRTLIVADPDGNELYFPDPDDKGCAR